MPAGSTMAPPTARSQAERDRLVTQNTGLVYHVVQQRYGAGHRDYDDLVGYGMLGLVHAARLWDETRGVKFSSYAYVCVLRAIDRRRPWFDLIRVPNHVVGEERAALRSALRPGSLDRRQANGCLSHDPPAPEAEPADDQAEDARRLREALARLDPRAADVLRMRFGLDEEARTLKEIGETLGVTKERVRQIAARAIDELSVLLGG